MTIMTTLRPINQDLAELSEMFMLVAACVYTAAFIAFTLDMVRSSSTIRRLEVELAQEHEAEVNSLVGASVSSQGAEANVAGDGADGQPPVGSRRDSSLGTEAEADLVDEEMTYNGNKRPIANVAVALTVLGMLTHAAAVASRGIAANRVPWANMFEFLTSAALIVTIVYLVALTRKDVRFLGVFAVGLVVTMMVAATIGFPTPVAHVQPSLQNPWIWIHVSLAATAIGIFTLTFAMNVLQLIQSRREVALVAGRTGFMDRALKSWQFLRMVPSAVSLENWAYRLNTVGFVFWTLGPLITGAIWAEQSWGRYWGWDTKEVWSFVIWVVYAGYLHARATRGWTGNRSAWLSIIGFACIIFNYAVVNVYFPGLHSYAGLPQ